MVKLIIFGPPGAGKGTYSFRLERAIGITKISTGDILRNEIKIGSEIGKKVEKYMNAGQLVPDEIVIEILKEALKKASPKGFILDGYPRTVNQAKILEKLTKIDAIINLIIPDEIIIEKMSARRICKNCGEIYNIADIHKTINGVEYILPPMLPKEDMKCDKCGGPLIQRDDDKPEVIRERIEVYKKQSKPVIDYYKGKVPFINIHVNRGPEIMVKKIIEELKKHGFIAD
jgi:adenylate kinase